MIKQPPQSMVAEVPSAYGSCTTSQIADSFCLAVESIHKQARKGGRGESIAVVPELKDGKTRSKIPSMEKM